MCCSDDILCLVCYTLLHRNLLAKQLATFTHTELPAMLFVSHLHLHLLLFILSLFIAKLATDIKQKPSWLVSLALWISTSRSLAAGVAPGGAHGGEGGA